MHIPVRSALSMAVASWLAAVNPQLYFSITASIATKHYTVKLLCQRSLAACCDSLPHQRTICLDPLQTFARNPTGLSRRQDFLRGHLNIIESSTISTKRKHINPDKPT